jgi:outer membrane protein assembly factor BamD
MAHSRSRSSRGSRLYLAFFTAAAACAPSFKLSQFRTNETLYAAARREYDRKHWDNAIQAFEKLSLELPARDSLLPRTHYYLGQAHERKGDRLLAAQSFQRLAESFPDDTLADDALYRAGQQYQALWRKPALDPQYGHTAYDVYQQLLALYPDTPVKDDAEKQVAKLDEWFATKDYDNGLYYLRRKAHDSALIYFRDVVSKYPSTDHARQSYLRMVDAFRAINYREDVKETCGTLWQKYPNDKEVRETCGPPPPTVAQPSP